MKPALSGTREPTALAAKLNHLNPPEVRSCVLPVAGLPGNAHRRCVVAVNDASRRLAAALAIHPAERSLNRLGGKASPVHVRRQDPTDFRDPVQRRLDGPPPVSKADVTDVSGAIPQFDGPEAEPQQLPVPCVPQQPRPALLGGGRFTAKEANHIRTAPHAGKTFAVFDPMSAKDEPLGLKDGYGPHPPTPRPACRRPGRARARQCRARAGPAATAAPRA